MPPLTAADVRNVAFNKPPAGKRGYDEESVDNFLDQVERSLAELHGEIARLRGGERYPTGETALLMELDQIKQRLARIESALAAGSLRRSY